MVDPPWSGRKNSWTWLAFEKTSLGSDLFFSQQIRCQFFYMSADSGRMLFRNRQPPFHSDEKRRKIDDFSWLMGGGSFLSINKLTKHQYHHQASAAEVKTSGDPKGQLNCRILGTVTGGKVVASWLFSWLVGSLIVLYILIVDLELTMRHGGAIWPIFATLIAALSPLYPLMLVRRLVWVLLFQNDPCKTWLRWSLIPWIFLDLC